MWISQVRRVKACWLSATNMSEFVSLYWKLDNPYYHTAQCSPWATGQAGGGWWWGIQLRITINFHNSWLSHVTRWNFDEKCNFFFTLQLRNLLFFYFALDFVLLFLPRATLYHSPLKLRPPGPAWVQPKPSWWRGQGRMKVWKSGGDIAVLRSVCS